MGEIIPTTVRCEVVTPDGQSWVFFSDAGYTGYITGEATKELSGHIYKAVYHSRPCGGGATERVVLYRDGKKVGSLCISPYTYEPEYRFYYSNYVKFVRELFF